MQSTARKSRATFKMNGGLPSCVNVSIFLSFRLHQANARLQDERSVLFCQNKGVFFYILQNAKCKMQKTTTTKNTRAHLFIIVEGLHCCCNARIKSAGDTIFGRCTLLAKWNGSFVFFGSTYQS